MAQSEVKHHAYNNVLVGKKINFQLSLKVQSAELTNLQLISVVIM